MDSANKVRDSPVPSCVRSLLLFVFSIVVLVYVAQRIDTTQTALSCHKLGTAESFALPPPIAEPLGKKSTSTPKSLTSVAKTDADVSSRALGMRYGSGQNCALSVPPGEGWKAPDRAQFCPEP